MALGDHSWRGPGEHTVSKDSDPQKKIWFPRIFLLTIITSVVIIISNMGAHVMGWPFKRDGFIKRAGCIYDQKVRNKHPAIKYRLWAAEVSVGMSGGIEQTGGRRPGGDCNDAGPWRDL